MSKILSYSDNVNGVDWVGREPYTDDDIRKIDDPNGGLVEYPRTAIPSPFAQVDLVATAYAQLSANDKLEGPEMYRRLVSNALDIAQVLFAYPDYADTVRIVRWHPRTAISQLLQNPATKLMGETLQLFMETDSSACNFDLDDSWYILMHNNRVLGGTCPATYTMGAPQPDTYPDIMLEEGVPLFAAEARHLWQRNPDFIEYFVHIYNAYPRLRELQKPVYEYILVNLDILRRNKPEVYRNITERIANPHALPTQAEAARLTESIAVCYDEFRDGINPSVCGVPLYTRKRDSILNSIGDSDFILRPQYTEQQDKQLPLVLTNGFSAPGGERFIYLNRYWQDSTVVDTQGLPISERVLPGTSIKYPWITVGDLLEDDLIELSTPIDTNHFFTATDSRNRDQNGWILPIKPLFFQYFNPEMLMGNVAPGKPVIEIHGNQSQVSVTLRIPTRKSYVELTRTYLRGIAAPDAGIDPAQCGKVIQDNRLSVSIFPFVRTGKGDMYNVQLFEMMPDHEVSMTFCNERDVLQNIRDPYTRTQSRVARTMYTSVDHTFTHIGVSIQSMDGREMHRGVILPRWPEYRPSADRYTFAVDFGTTNTHVEYAREEMPPAALAFDASSEATLVATLARPGTLAQADTYTEIEFLPREIKDLYGFPLRTALTSNTGSDVEWHEVLRSINIPFLYERKAFNGYDVATGLKWSEETALSEQFLREIVMLIRARVLVSGGNPANVRLIYFYPVSMKRSMRMRLLSMWESLYDQYLNPDKRQISAYPESIAPTFYYNSAGRDGANFVSIDIGGGTSDVVVYKADTQRFMSELDTLTSFRFAGNSIFGDGFARADADANPLVRKYSKHFSNLFGADPYLSYLDVILKDISESKRSEDINAYLFSIEHAEALSHLSPVDRHRYSYNALLAADEEIKIVFVYFYSAIIYYVSKLMHDAGLEMPRQIFYSGTGSKILSILGRNESVTLLSRRIFSLVYGQECTDLRVVSEQKIPKQITGKGGIGLLRQTEAGDFDPLLFSEHRVMSKKHAYTLTRTDKYTYQSVRTLQERNNIAAEVRAFNAFFHQLMDHEMRDEFGITASALSIFDKVCNTDIDAYLAAGIKTFLPDNGDGTETVEDVPFFYPITGIIRNSLLPALMTKNTDETE